MKRFLVFLLLSPAFSQAQIWAGFSGGLSFTTVNPHEKYTIEQSSRVTSAHGKDFGITFSGDLTNQIRFLGRLTYNKTEADVFHRYIEVQGLENYTIGNVNSQYLGLYLAPQWHKGNKVEFVYGLGFYSGFKMSGTLTGQKYTVKDGKESSKLIMENDAEDSYRNLATGLFTTVGFNFKISPKLQANLNADVILFLNAKNLIFEDTGSVNEINLRFGVSYLFEKREE